MRKGVTGLSLLLIFSLVPAYSATPPKAGSVCAKQGLTKTHQGKKYTCIKSGIKLVWNKGVAKKASATTPQRTVFMPWATQFDVTSMTQVALDSTRSYFGKVQPSNNYEINFDPAISPADRDWVSRVTDFAYGSFSNFYKEKPIIYVGSSRKWALEELKAKGIWIGDPNDSYPCSAKNDDAGCAGINKMLVLFSAKRLLTQDSGEKFMMRTTTAHEMFHIIQKSLHVQSGPGTPTRIPQWLFEGSAAFYQFFVGEEIEFDKYQTGRNYLVVSNLEYRNILPLSQYDGGNLNPYGIGMAASEYIIASIGFENFLNIWSFTKSEGSFAAGFKKATGIEIDNFYSKFEVARSSMRIGF
jgi:hypothetical protein